ncbi:MAG: gamma-glutamyl-gamma-aminobutyrate hydrolase family protein [Chloroflexota bacterium]|nr:gamma-glutamyl-gamma-aminobutyrate hydrolase family protein [Chloroflexota bacterium]
MKPLIGITPSPSTDTMGHGAFHRYCLARTYVDSVRAAGGIPVILPTDRTDLTETLSRLDGLLLSGGGDLDPATYGDADVHEKTYGIDDERDSFETLAFSHALDHDLPTLCICRGIQVMAVAQGGSLVQDIPSQVTNALEHRQHNIGKMRNDVSHTVTIAANNPLRDIVGESTFEVNSFHHQSVKDPGQDLEIIAEAEDGVIEALWHPAMCFGLGVQWHPEILASHHSRHAALFAAFVAASAAVPASR